MPDLRIGDPVMDAAQGRPMVVVDAPDETVAEWSERENYDLQGNYANSKFDPEADEPVVECVYVGDVRSEPSKTYTFPVSRVVLIDVHRSDGEGRIYERVARDVLERLFAQALTVAEARQEPSTGFDVVRGFAEQVFDEEIVDEASELAEVDRQFDDQEESDDGDLGDFEGGEL